MLELSESQLHARDIVHELVEDGIDTIFAGGGDGTIDTINNVYDLRDRTDNLPAVGALKLGTEMHFSYWLKIQTQMSLSNIFKEVIRTRNLECALWKRGNTFSFCWTWC